MQNVVLLKDLHQVKMIEGETLSIKVFCGSELVCRSFFSLLFFPHLESLPPMNLSKVVSIVLSSVDLIRCLM